MSTNLEVISAALKLINVIGQTDTASPEQGAYCLSELNDLIESWTENGIDLGYFRQDDTTDDCPIPTWAERGVKAALAIEVAPHYGATISPGLAKKYDDGYGIILRKSIVETLPTQDMSSMPMGEGMRGSASILTDE